MSEWELSVPSGVWKVGLGWGGCEGRRGRGGGLHLPRVIGVWSIKLQNSVFPVRTSAGFVPNKEEGTDAGAIASTHYYTVK